MLPERRPSSTNWSWERSSRPFPPLASTWRLWSTRTFRSLCGTSAVRTRSARCGATTSRTRRYEEELSVYQVGFSERLSACGKASRYIAQLHFVFKCKNRFPFLLSQRSRVHQFGCLSVYHSWGSICFVAVTNRSLVKIWWCTCRISAINFRYEEDW